MSKSLLKGKLLSIPRSTGKTVELLRAEHYVLKYRYNNNRLDNFRRSSEEANVLVTDRSPIILRAHFSKRLNYGFTPKYKYIQSLR